METRARAPSVGLAELGRLVDFSRHYLGEPSDPQAVSPVDVVRQRVQRLARVEATRRLGLFEKPVAGERYVLYPIHFQPEASTLVQAPYYLDQLALIEDIAKSLPAGTRLYVKEHLSNRGRRPVSFYRRIRETFSTRLLGPDEDSWDLVKNAAAIAVITGTMGWEGLIFGRPVVTFGNVFYNVLPQVHQAGSVPKDRWNEVFERAIHHGRSNDEALTRYLVALDETSFPGFMKNPNTFPKVLAPDNVRCIADALGHSLRATAGDPAAQSHPLARDG
jgi:hypothetical protein